MTMKTFGRLGITIILAGALAACESTGASSPRGGTSETRTGGSSREVALNTVRDTRITYYEPATGARIILVNENHRLRKTSAGRRRLAGRSKGYKVAADKAIDALLESIKNRKEAAIKSPFTRSDDRYLTSSRNAIPGYKGIIVIENNGRTLKYLGMRPKGSADVVGQQKYKIYVDLKVLVIAWANNHSRVERPSAFTIEN